jgi:membrane protease YdiL (CAAX protease family)
VENKIVKHSFSKIGFIGLIVILVQVGVGILLTLLFPAMESDVGLLLTVQLPLSYLIILPIGWLIVRKSSAPEQMPVKHTIPAGKIVVWAVISFGLMRIVAVITNIVLNAVSGGAFTDPVTSLQLGSPWLMLIPMVVVAPIAEEIIFRGFLYKVLAPYGAKYFILISALLFSLFHANIPQIFGVFVLGAFLAYVMYRTGNILLVILLHFINNLIAQGSALFVGSETGMQIAGLVAIAIMLASVVLGIVWLATKRVKRDVIFEPAPVAPAKAGHAFGNLGIIVCIIAMIALTVYSTISSL